MNGEMVKQINHSIEDSRISVSDDVNKSIVFKVEKRLIDRQAKRHYSGIHEQFAKINDNLIEIGFNDIYILLINRLRETTKYIKKVDFTKPFRQNVMGRFFDIELDADYTSSTTWLYVQLRDMYSIDISLFAILIEQINKTQEKFSKMISKNDFSDISIYNKTSLLASMEGLKQMKLSLKSLWECYKMILLNPEVKEFYIKWLGYKQRLACEIDHKCGIKGLFSMSAELEPIKALEKCNQNKK